MKVIAKLVIASVFALSAIVPALAAEEDTLLEREGNMSARNAFAQQEVVKHARTHKAVNARAYAPASAPADDVTDFSIGSQR
ncbi:MAG TPA: hypothetical protein VFI98_15185 [Pseudolabrys sp.]|nr:hypothetical protein [Pseudolabrys sp.]